MIQKIYTGSDESVLEEKDTNGLGEFIFHHPMGTFSLTPASRILFEAITENKEILHGVGIDWGSGIGCQAILASRIDGVNQIFGLEISKDNIDIAIQNAKENNVKQKVNFILADSYHPMAEEDRQRMQALKGNVDFILSNPPSSDWDDGFGFRRIVLTGAKDFLKANGIVLLNISFQYGIERIQALANSIHGFDYMGVIASTECVPFDLGRPDLLDCLKIYARVEQNGDMNYTFIKDEKDENSIINACTALHRYEESGVSPFTKWQTHLFQYKG